MGIFCGVGYGLNQDHGLSAIYTGLLSILIDGRLEITVASIIA
jgi:hypothetical protein